MRDLLGHVRAVLRDALRAGGTSFDALYVNVNGESGYFDRSLAVYGQEGRAVPALRHARSAGPPFMNRSSFFCPRLPAAAAGRARPLMDPRSHTGNTQCARC